MKIPYGTYGHLMESKFGKMVQWQFDVDGWLIFDAELKVQTMTASLLPCPKSFSIRLSASFIPFLKL